MKSLAPVGRPRLPDMDRRTHVMNIRLTEHEYLTIANAAKKHEIIVSRYVRDLVVDFARADLAGELG